MFTLKNPKLAIKVLSLLLIAAVSFFIAKDAIANARFVEESLQTVEENRNTVMKLSAATLSASLVISAFPDDFATPFASSLSNMNFYFVFLLMVLFLEKVLLKSGIELAFGGMIPVACIIGAIAIAIGPRENALKSLAARILALALAIAFVVPCSTYATKLVEAEIATYVDDAIIETTEGTSKIDEAIEGDDNEKTAFEKLSDLFHTAASGISGFFDYMKNTIRKCMNSIAILIVSNFVMPLVTFFVLKWVLKETFDVVISSFHSPSHTRKQAMFDDDEAHEKELPATGEQ